MPGFPILWSFLLVHTQVTESGVFSPNLFSTPVRGSAEYLYRRHSLCPLHGSLSAVSWMFVSVTFHSSGCYNFTKQLGHQHFFLIYGSGG
jgi:hypothetical protein